MERTLKAGITGLGLVAASHLKGYQKHPKAEVTSVCDVNKERAEKFAAEQRIPKVYTSYDELIADPEIDIIDIATPTFLHAEMTQKAAEAGKHVHCEKPFCRFLGEGKAALDAVKKAGKTLLVGETYVFTSAHQKARELIDQGEIGRPLQIRQRHGAWLERPDAVVYSGPADRNWRVDPEKSGGGGYPWIFDHAVHFFSSAEYFVPGKKIQEVYAIPSRDPKSRRLRGAKHDPYMTQETDIPMITWRYDDPAFQGVWMRAERLNGKYDYMRGFSTTIVGEEGMIEVLGEGGGNLLWNGEQYHLILHKEGNDPKCFRFNEGGDDIWISEISYYSKGHINQVMHFIDCILESKEPVYTGEDGIRAIASTLATIKSAEEERPVQIHEIDDNYRAYGSQK